MNPTLQKTLCFGRVIPDQVNRTESHRLDASGKGVNVSRVLRQLGKRVVHLTHLGGELRPLFLALCQRDNLDVRWVDSHSPIRFCYTLITGEEPAGAGPGREAPGGRTVTELVEEGEAVFPGTEDRLLSAFKELLGVAGTVIISGTKARGYGDALVPEMVRLARERGKRIILDVRGTDLERSLSHGPDLVKPNLVEFVGTFAPGLASPRELSGDEEGVKSRVADLILELAGRYRTRIVLTRGSRSVWYADGSVPGTDGAEASSPVFDEYLVERTPPVNTVGSGDAFTAGLAAALDEGYSLRDAIAQGAGCGGLNAGFLKPGVIRE